MQTDIKAIKERLGMLWKLSGQRFLFPSWKLHNRPGRMVL